MEIFETVVEALCRLKKKRMAQGRVRIRILFARSFIFE